MHVGKSVEYFNMSTFYTTQTAYLYFLHILAADLLLMLIVGLLLVCEKTCFV
jgi:hypothetical protein